MENNIIFNDEGKLYVLGKMDGKERALKILSSNPENLDKLDPIGVKEYLQGYEDGIKEAIREYKSNKNGKTR